MLMARFKEHNIICSNFKSELILLHDATFCHLPTRVYLETCESINSNTRNGEFYLRYVSYEQQGITLVGFLNPDAPCMRIHTMMTVIIVICSSYDF